MLSPDFGTSDLRKCYQDRVRNDFENGEVTDDRSGMKETKR